MRVTDRSRIESGFYCPTLRDLRYHHDGLGIVPDSESNDLSFGKQMHAALAIGMQNPAIPENPATLLEQMLTEFDRESYVGLTPDRHATADELWAMFYGFCYTFTYHFREHLLSLYQPIAMELELTFPIPIAIQENPMRPISAEVIGMARIDGALRKRSDGSLFVLEWKTSAYVDRLGFQYEYALQTSIEVAALQHALDERVAGMLLIGIDKGINKAVSDKEREAGLMGKRHLSPFTYVYQQDNGFKVDRSATYKYGWERVMVEDPIAHMAFLEEQHPEVFGEIFATPHPLYVTPWQVERTLYEIGIIEGRIASGERPLHYWTNCHNHQGVMNSECPYIQICHHNEWDGFVPRTPHHALEASLQVENA